MFANASAFNQDVSNWNISKVTNTSYMFYNATSFNQNVSKWTMTAAKNKIGMFDGASAMKSGKPAGV